MDADALKKAFNELYPHLEWQQTQITALLEFLTAKGIITDQEFDPFVEEAGKRSSVKWLAARLRVEHALSESKEEEEKPAEISTKPPAEEPEEERAQANESQQPAEKAEQNVSGEEKDGEAEEDGTEKRAGDQTEQEAA